MLQSIYLSIYLFSFLSIQLSIYIAFYLFSFLSIQLSIYLAFYLFTFLSIQFSIYLAFYVSIYLSIQDLQYSSPLSMGIPACSRLDTRRLSCWGRVSTLFFCYCHSCLDVRKEFRARDFKASVRVFLRPRFKAQPQTFESVDDGLCQVIYTI